MIILILLGSRYEDAEIYFVVAEGSEEPSPAVAAPVPDSAVTANRFRRWSSSDRWDHLASEYYGNSRHWWKILDANPEIEDPFLVTPGTVLRIP